MYQNVSLFGNGLRPNFSTFIVFFFCFTEAIVIVLDSFCTEAQKLLVEICEVKMHLDFVSIPDQDYMGTADSLRFIQDKIKVSRHDR